MSIIRDLFDPSRPIDRRIEKVITYDNTADELLEHEINEYVATESIQGHFERLLDVLEDGITGGKNPEVGIWVSGFYGSGKSSFTKYLGFALDPNRTLSKKPFREWLADRFSSKPLRQRLNVVAKKCPAVVIMVDLASDQWAGATLGSISGILYAKVMEIAGYSRDEKIAYLEFMLERDGRFDAFKQRVRELSGVEWESVRNQPLVMKAFGAKVAVEFYPQFFPDVKTFNEIKLEERIKESERIKEMLDLLERKTGHRNVIFILDEVGQYVAARDELMLNLDGLAKNVKNIGRGSAWIIATAQQTLTEDDPRAITNSAKLFKLKDRFPITVDLEASDIREICYNRLLSKSPKGMKTLQALFDRHGPQFRHATELKDTQLYRSDLTAESFCRFYPVLPHHFEILLRLLGRLARTRGGVGLRSAIKVIQDLLTDPGAGQTALGHAEAGTLATAVMFYDTLRQDIRKPFPHIVEGIEKAVRVFGADSLEVKVAKAIGVLQVLEDFPVSRGNIAAMIHPSIDSASCADAVDAAVEKLVADRAIPINEVDGQLRFMSAAVLDLDKQRALLLPSVAETRKVVNTALGGLFTALPSADLEGKRTIKSGIKVMIGSQPTSLSGEKEAIQTHVEFVAENRFDKVRDERIGDSQQRANQCIMVLLGREDPEIENLALEAFRCFKIHEQYRNKTVDKDVEDYLRGQQQRETSLGNEIARRLARQLLDGSFVFRGKPQAVSVCGPDLPTAADKQMADVARQVFEKYPEAPLQAASNLAEEFMKTEDLQKMPTKNDPLGLVQKKPGGATINVEHKALLSVRNYLETNGAVDGHKLLNDFFEPPYGWSKDTTRYLVAALFVASKITLRTGGVEVKTRAGNDALNAIRTTNTFNKVTIALRDTAPALESLLRAKDRLLQITGQEVAPIEEDISRCVIRHFPSYQQQYAPLRTRLENFALPGIDRIENVYDNLAESIKGGASDAVIRLGGEQCPFFDDLLWARDVDQAFANGLSDTVAAIRELLKEIPALPHDGPPGDLINDSKPLCQELHDTLAGDDFHAKLVELRRRLQDLLKMVADHAQRFIDEENAWLRSEIKAIQDMPEWSRIGTEEQANLTADLERLAPQAELTVAGMRQLLNSRYTLTQKIKVIRKRVGELGAMQPDRDNGTDPHPEPHPTPPGPGPKPGPTPPLPPPPDATRVVKVKVATTIATARDLERLIADLKKALAEVKQGKTLHIDWS